MKRASQMTKRASLICAAFCVCSSIAWDSPNSRKDNSVTSLNYSQDSARTHVEIGVSDDPTFSVYALKNPDRVVVEILDCESSQKITPIQVRNGVVDTAAVSMTQSEDYRACRIILGLERETTYAVDSGKDKIIVSIDGAPQLSPTQLADAYAEMQKSRDEALANARTIVEREQAASKIAQEEALKAKSDAEQLLERERKEHARIEQAYAEAQAKIAQIESQRRADLAQAARDGADITAKLEASKNEQLKAQSESDTLKLAKDRALERAHSAETQLAQANDKLEQLARVERELDKMQQTAQALNDQKRDAEQRAQTAEAQLKEAQAKLAELSRVQSDLGASRQNAQALNDQKRDAEQRAQTAEAQLKEARATIARLETETTDAKRSASDASDRYREIASQNAALMSKLESQNAEMAKLQKEVLSGGAAREKLKKLEAKQKSQKEAMSQEQAALMADLKSQARQGRHALEQLNKLKAENDALKAQIEDQAVNYQAVATTAPIDATVGAAQKARAAESRAQAPVDDDAAALASIRDIQFKNDGDGMKVVVKLSSPVSKVQSIDGGLQKSILRIDGAVLPDDFNKKYDTSALNKGIKYVDSTKTSSGIELIAQASSKTVDAFEQNGDTITWRIKPLRSEGKSYSAPIDRRNAAMLSAAEPNSYELSSTFGAQKSLKDSPLAKRKITLDIHDADINDLLRLLSDEINTSIVVNPDVKGNVTLSLKSVPLDQALDIILRMHNLGMRYEGNVIWIAKAETFRAEEERQIKAAEVRERLEPLEVRLIPVNYATASDLQTNVSSLLSSRGTVNIDTRTNTLILKDVAANLDAAEILVNNLDTQTPQILIEARIVETQANFTKEIGIQWGGDGIASAQTGNATGIVFPSTVGIAGGSTSDNNAGTSSSPNFAVNLPASVGTGAGGALGITLGSLGGAINLNIRLSALENKGFLKIVSAPRIMTLDNIQASIQQGTSIPISVVSAAGAQTVFYDAKLNLEVTPHVTRDGNVYLKINITKNEPDFGNTGASGDPSIIQKEAHTELLVPDGETTVIGGIYTRNTSQSMASVPFFGSIPILGYLFKSTSETDNRTELLIFITPRIINRDASIAASGHGSFIPPVEREDESKK